MEPPSLSLLRRMPHVCLTRRSHTKGVTVVLASRACSFGRRVSNYAAAAAAADAISLPLPDGMTDNTLHHSLSIGHIYYARGAEPRRCLCVSSFFATRTSNVLGGKSGNGEEGKWLVFRRRRRRTAKRRKGGGGGRSCRKKPFSK